MMNKNVLMILKYTVLIICLTVFTMPTVVGSDGPPTIPVQYWGYVTIDGSPAASGTLVEIKDEQNNALISTNTIAYNGQQFYVLTISSDYNGETITFFVNDMSTTNAIVPVSGSSIHLDLNAVSTPIPEFPTIALPVISVLGMMYIVSGRKKKSK
jgi:hypothetical protein